jgi:hypothetical protein
MEGRRLCTRYDPQKSAYQLVSARQILQCVGQIKIGSSAQALYQLLNFRRHGKPNGIMPVLSSSPTSKSQSSGAVGSVGAFGVAAMAKAHELDVWIRQTCEIAH